MQLQDLKSLWRNNGEIVKGKQNVNLVTEYVTDEQMRYYFHQCDFVILPYKNASQSGVVLDADKFGRSPITFAKCI